jgi:aryl sulfotransferase
MDGSLVRYRSIVADNARWEGFGFRGDDIIISTPAKCGTTWTQMICALLIFQTSDLPLALDQHSPWLDMLTLKIEDVKSLLDAQSHRRFIKSHTPLDGLPWDERVTYITVGRDPRDVGISWDNHMNNLDLNAFIAQRHEAVGLDDLAELMPDGIPTFPEEQIDRFWQWVDTPETGVGSLIGTLHHLDTFWQRKDEPNVVLLHYDDLGADLEGQMRALADRLGIEVAEDRWADLARAATFGSMRDRAEKAAPNATAPIWHDTKRFFNRGTSGQWRELLDDEGLRRYEERARGLVSSDLYGWVHR